MDDDVTRSRQDAAPVRRPVGDARHGSWGQLDLIERLGVGGFGEVYRAWDRTLQREVALKLLLPRSPDEAVPDADPEAEYRDVLREARALAKVHHPNVISVHGVDRHEGRVGFWSDFVRGQTLSALIEDRGRFSPAEAVAIGIELCRALGAIHQAGLLHRDIKASNVMRADGGRIVLMDFGLSHEVGTSAHRGGTMAYMAPELLTGHSASVATDIFALGVLLYQLVAGKLPGRVPGSGQLPSLFDQRPDLPPAFVRVIEEATDPEPSRRFPTAGALSTALSRSMSQEPAVAGSPAAVPSRGWPRKATAAAVLAVTAAIVAVLLWVTFRGGPDSPVSPPQAAFTPYLEARSLLVRYDVPGNTEKALELFQTAVNLQPDSALAHAGLAHARWRHYLNTSDASLIDLALKDCERAMALDAKLATVRVALATIYIGTGKLDLGLQELQQAERLDPRSAELFGAFSEAYRLSGRTADSAAALERAADLDPQDWRWPYLLGALRVDEGRYAAAEAELAKALEITPDNSRVLYNLGVARFQAGRFAESETVIAQAAVRAPTFRVMTALGSAQLLQGKFSEATAALKRATELNPNHYLTWGNLGTAYRWAGDPAKAQDAFDKAIELAGKELRSNRTDAVVISNLGSYYATLSRPQESVPLLRQAVALAPANPDVVYRVGEAYELLGRRADALRWIRTSLDLGYSPDYIRRNPELRELRADAQAPEVIRESK